MARRTSMALALTSLGCSAQLGLGTAPTQVPESAQPTLLAASVQAEPGRGSGSMVGVQTEAVRDSGIAVRNASLSTGYKWRLPVSIKSGLPPLAVEAAFHLGGGMPAFRRFEGSGVYTGTTLGLRMRVIGDDLRPEYHVLLPYVDAVFVTQQGVWMPPEGGPTHALYGEWVTIFALRFAVQSSLVSVGLPRTPPRTRGPESATPAGGE